MRESPVQVGLFGAASITGREHAGDLLARPKRFAVLAWLCAATPTGFQRRDRLLAMFWPERDESAARNSLRQTLHGIRGAIGDDALVARGTDEIGVNPDVVRCDVVEFHASLASGHLARALELYRGELLDGVHVRSDGFERWLTLERERLGDLAADAAWRLAEKFEAGADLTGASRWARRAARLAKADERRVRRVVRLLERAGDSAGAIKVYDEFADYLRRELDTEPSEETRDLVAAVRASVRSGKAARPTR